MCEDVSEAPKGVSLILLIAEIGNSGVGWRSAWVMARAASAAVSVDDATGRWTCVGNQ